MIVNIRVNSGFMIGIIGIIPKSEKICTFPKKTDHLPDVIRFSKYQFTILTLLNNIVSGSKSIFPARLVFNQIVDI